jgi:hypothetical protein
VSARRLALIAVLAAALGAVVAADQYAPMAEPSPSPGTPILSAWLAGAYRPAACATTPEQTWGWTFSQGARSYPGPSWTVVVAGRLATYPKRNLSPSDAWFIAADPRASIRLRATRLDRDMPPIDFEAIGRPINARLPEGFDRSWYYVNSVDTADHFPTVAGCWKVQLVDGDPERDVIVVSLRGPAPIPNR